MSTRIPPYDIPEPTPLTKEELRASFARSHSLRTQLASTFRGQISIRGEPVFAKSITIFNDAAPLGGWMVTIPVDVQDVSTVVKFCNVHDLSPSIKSGGFATAGWAIQGQVVIDTSLLDHVKLVVLEHVPNSAAALLAPDLSPLTVPPKRNPASYDPSCLAASPTASTSYSGPSALASSPPAPVPVTGVAAISPVTDPPHSSSIPQSATGSIAELMVEQQLYSTVQQQSALPSISKSDSSQDIDPQDAINNALKRKYRELDDASLNAYHLQDSSLASSVQRKTDPSNDPCPDADAISPSMQHGRSHESGADADSESSFASSAHDGQENALEADHKPSGSISAGGVATSRSDFLHASEPRDSAPLYPTGSQDSVVPSSATVPAKVWVDRQLEVTGNASDSPGGSNAGSNGTGSSSSTLR